MNVQVEERGSGVVVTVDGQVDMHTSPDLRRPLRKALGGRRTPIIVDLGLVSFIDSSGLATLIETRRDIGDYGGELRLAAPQPPVKNLFRLSKLSSIFQIYDTLDEAVEA